MQHTLITELANDLFTPLEGRISRDGWRRAHTRWQCNTDKVRSHWDDLRWCSSAPGYRGGVSPAARCQLLYSTDGSCPQGSALKIKLKKNKICSKAYIFKKKEAFLFLFLHIVCLWFSSVCSHTVRPAVVAREKRDEWAEMFWSVCEDRKSQEQTVMSFSEPDINTTNGSPPVHC